MVCVGGWGMRFRQLRATYIIASLMLTSVLATTTMAQTARNRSTTSLLPNGNVLIAGGVIAGDIAVNTTEIFVSTNGSFLTVGSLTTARSSHTATVLPDGRVLIAGGCTGGGPCLAGDADITATAELFDPRTNTFTPTGSMSTPRVSHTATLMPNGTVLIVGGQTNFAGTTLASCEIFDPALNNFSTPCANLAFGRAGHTSTLLHTGRVFIAGGYGTNSLFTVTTELYNFATNNWSSGAALITKRGFHTATQMGNQKLLITGGVNEKNFQENQGLLESAEIYDPNANSFSPAAVMSQRRAFHTSTLHADGSVIVFGGLANITTSFFTGALNFEANSRLVVNAIAGVDAVGTLNPVGSTLTIVLDGLPLSSPVNGIITNGTMFFSSPSIKSSDVDFFFPWETGTPAPDLTGTTAAPLTGRVIDQGNGGLTGTVTVSEFQGGAGNGGLAFFFPIDVSPADIPPPEYESGSVVGFAIAGGGAAASAQAAFTMTSLRIDNLLLPVPDSAIAGVSVLRGKAQILPGTELDATTSPNNKPYTLQFTTGATVEAAINVTVTLDANGDKVIDLDNVQFFGVAGIITNSTDTTITNADALATLNASPTKIFNAGSIRLFFTFSPVDISGGEFTIDVATIVIRNFLSGDVEAYIPFDPEVQTASNRWGLTTVLSGRMGSNSLLLPNQDEFYFGGVTCLTEAICSSGVFTPLGFGGALIPHKRDDDLITWDEVNSLTHPRANHSATLLPDQRLLIAGGTDGTDVVKFAETYDRKTDLWFDTFPMKTPRSHHTATLLPNGNVLVAGGFTTAAGTGATSTAEIFYPNTNTWVETGSMISSRSFHTSVVLPDGNVMVVGGFTEGSYLETAEVYYSTMHVWVPLASMDTKRAQYTISMLRNGRVLVSGGVNATGVLGDSAASGIRGNEIYNYNTNTWSAAAPMTDPRHSHTATVLQDGQALMAGGNDGFGEISRAELYDPLTNTWTQTSTNGNNMLTGRLNHTATLIPNNKVYFAGGFTALNQVVNLTESFDVAFSSFGWDQNSNESDFQSGRGDHTVTLLDDQTMIMVGGIHVGALATGKVETLKAGEVFDFFTVPDGLPRRPEILKTDSPRYLPGQRMTLTGNQFRGRGEAGASGAGSGHSSHHHPRLVLQRIGGGGMSSSNDGGVLVDLSSGIFHNQLTSWAQLDSSMTVLLPETDDLLPFGWYSARIITNAQFSDSKIIQISSPVPTELPGTPSVAQVFQSSISWSWDRVATETVDGYNVYSATGGIFIATVTPSGGLIETFVQRNLGPDTSAQIKIAAFTIGGDGPVRVATVPVLTADSSLNNVTGTPQTTQTIFWSWPVVNNALSYEILTATGLTPLGTSVLASFTQTGLSTNTAFGVVVRAVMPGGPGKLSETTTAFTLAAIPFIGGNPVTNISTGNFVVSWVANSNPDGTAYQLRFLEQLQTVQVTLPNTSKLDFDLVNLSANTIYTLEVQAFNGDGIGSGFAQIGSTVTLATPPESPIITENTASKISISWDPGENHAFTEYEILVSSDNFVSDFSTRATFGSQFFATSISIENLITGQAYAFRIAAIDQFGRRTAQVSTNTITDNGGGPPGSIAFVVPRTGITVFGGTLGGANRNVSFRIQSNTFDVDTRIFVSTEATLNCGNIDAAINITPLPAIQPQAGFEMSLEYFPSEPNLGSLQTLGIVRWDPASGKCVPLPSVVDEATNRVIASVNHLSLFQLQQLNPSSTISSARVFPNPMFKGRQDFFTFDGLPAGARIRIFTITGGEVFDGTTNASGIAKWDATNKAGRIVSSGVYVAVIEKGGSVEKLKLVVIR